jgi:hypothetical protein
VQQGCSSRVGHSGRHTSIGSRSAVPEAEFTTGNGPLRRQTTGEPHRIRLGLCVFCMHGGG